MAFNINAQVILSGPKNLGKISKQIQQGLGKSGSIKVAIDPSSLRNIKILNSTVSNLNGNIANLNQSATKLQSTLTGVNSGLSKANTATSNFSKNQNNTASSINNVNKALQQQNQQLGNLGKRFLSTAKTAIAFGLISRPIYDLQRAFIGATKDAVAFEREIVRISQVTGQTVKQLSNLRNDINRLATSLGISANELAETARIITQTGKTAEETRIILESLSRSTLAPTFGSITDTTEGLVAALGQFNLEAKDSEAILGALNRVSKNFAVEAEDLISVIRRTGGVFAQAAGDSRNTIGALEELISIFTAVRSTTRESADTIAAGLRTIFSRIQRRGTIEFLEQFGVQLTNAKGQFIGVFPAFDELSRKLDTLIKQGDALTLSAIAEELGGIRQIGKLLPAIAQFDKARSALEEAQKGAAEGLSGDVAKALDTIDNRLKRVRESFNELIRTVFESPAFQSFAKTILTVSEQLLKLSTSVVKFIEPLLPVLAALGAAKLGQVVGGAIGGGGLASAASTVTGQATATNTAQVAAAAQQSVSIEQQMLSALNQMSTQLSNIFSLQSADNKLRNGQLSNLIQINQAGFNQVATAQRTVGATPTFAGVGGGRGARRRASGGKIYGFNRGGMVPGTGNGDTVPAMLEPGEFVIKKSSVNSIGADRLASMNKYAGGGLISAITDPKIKATISEPDPYSLSKSSGKKFLLEGSGRRRRNKFTPEDRYELNLQQERIDPLNDSRVPENLRLEYQNAIDESRRGFVFEKIAAAVIGFTETEDRARLDGIKGDTVYEVKSRIKTLSFNEAAQKVVGAALGIGSVGLADKSRQAILTNKQLTTGTDTVDFGNIVGVEDAAKVGFSDDEQLSDIEKRKRARIEKRRKNPKAIGRAFLNSGGSVSGQDTVPALLTPGEFVFNKKSASKIGYGNLNTMNKQGVVGFNKGGVVGFKNGGKATGGGSFDFGKLQEASGKAVQGFGNLTSTAFLLQGSLTSTSSLFEEGGFTFSNVIGSVTTSLLAFQSVLSAIQSLQLLGSFGGLSKAIKGVPGLLKGGLGGLNKKLGGLGKRLQAGFGDSKALTGQIGKAQEKLAGRVKSRKQFLTDAFDPNTQRFKNRSKAGKVGKGTFASLKDVKTGKSQFGKELRGRNIGIKEQAGRLRGLQNKIKIPGLDKFSKLLGRIPGGGAAGKVAGQFGTKAAAQIGKVLAAGISGPVAAALGTALVAIPLGSFIGKALGDGFDKLAFGAREEVAGFKGREGQGAAGAAASGVIREGLGGAGLGAGVGAAIGSIIPGVGTAIGAAIGGAVGLIAGSISGAINGPLEQASFEAAKKLQKDTEQVGKSLEQFAKSGSIADFDTFLDNFLAQGDSTTAAFETFTNQFDNQVGLLDFTPIGSFTKGIDAAGKLISGDFVGAANSAIKGIAGSSIAGAVGSGAARVGAGAIGNIVGGEKIDLSNVGKSLDDAIKKVNPFEGTRLAQIVNTQFGGALAGLNLEKIGNVVGKGAENIRANIKKFGDGVAKAGDQAFKDITGLSFGEAKKNIQDGLKKAGDAFNQAATAAFRATPIGLVSYLLGPAEAAADNAESQAQAAEEQAKREAQARGKAAKVTKNQLKAVERIQTLIDPKQVEEARKALSQGLQKLVETGELGVDFEGLDVSTKEGQQEARSRIRAKAEEQSPEGERARKLLAAESQQITNELAVVSKQFKAGGDKAGKKTGQALDSLQAAILSGQIDPSNQEEVNAFLKRFGAAGKDAATEFEKIAASSDGALGAAINAGLLAKALKEAEKALNTFNAELKTIQDDLAFATESSAVAMSNLKDTTDALSNGQILFTQKLDGFDFGKAGAGARQDRIAAIGATTGVNVEGIQKFDTVISNADEIGKDAFEELSSRAEDGKASLQDVTSALEKGIEKELGFELPEGPLKEGLKKSLEGFGRQLGDGSDIPLDKLKEAIEDGKVGELLGPAFEEVQKTTKQLSETFNQLNNIAAEEANLRLQIAQQQLEAQKEVRKRTRAIEDTAIDPEKAFKGDPLALAQKRLDEDIADLGFAGKSAVEIAEAQRQARDEQIKLNEQLQAGTISQEEFAKQSAVAANANANASAALNQLANDTSQLSAIQQKAAKLIEARDASRQQVTDEIVARETGDVAGIARRREQSRVVQAGIQEGASQGDRRRLLVAAAQDPSLQREIALQQRAQARERGDTSLEGLTTQEIFDKTLIEDLESRLATESDPLERARIEQQIEDIKAPGLEDLQKQAVEIQQNQLAVQQLIAANQQLLLRAQLEGIEGQREALKAELAKNTEKLNGLLQQQGQQAATQQEQAQVQQQQLQAQQEQAQQQAAGAAGAEDPLADVRQDIAQAFGIDPSKLEGGAAGAAGAAGGAGTGGIAATTPALEKLNKALEDNQKSVESGGYGFSEAAKQNLEQAQKYRQLEAESIAAGNTDLARQQGGIAEQFETSSNVRGFGQELSPVLNTGAAQRSIGEGLRGRTVRQDMKLSKSDQRFLEKGRFADQQNKLKKESEDRIAKRNRIDQELKRREDEARRLSSGRVMPGPNIADAFRAPQGPNLNDLARSPQTQANVLQDTLGEFQSLFGEFGTKIQENAQVMLDAADLQNAAGEKQIQAADTMPTNISHNMNTIEVNGLGNLANGLMGFAQNITDITQNMIDPKNKYQGAPDQGDGVSPRNLG